jgi:hypothetical protein
MRPHRAMLFGALLCVSAQVGCLGRPESAPLVMQETVIVERKPRAALDLLVVLDTSPASEALRRKLREQWPRILQGLRDPDHDLDFHDLRLGLISADLGADAQVFEGCKLGGAGAKLLRKPQSPGCPVPAAPWIEVYDMQHNIQGCSGDVADCLAESLRCMTPIGSGGCEIQMPLEAATRALDPIAAPTAGFLREGVTKAVLFVSAGIDCSVRPDKLGAGPASVFSCFERGVSCNLNGPALGARHGCEPGFDWLQNIEHYVQQLRRSAPPTNLVVGLIAGPGEPVVVGAGADGPQLEASCTGAEGLSAQPATRLHALVDAFDGRSTSACAPKDYPQALAALGERTLPGFSTRSGCLQKLPLTRDGLEPCGLKAGVCEPPGALPPGCLADLDCSAVRSVAGVKTPLARCPTALYEDASDDDCGASCPCWRVVPSASCAVDDLSAPLRFEILRRDQPLPDTKAILRCLAVDEVCPWP